MNVFERLGGLAVLLVEGFSHGSRLEQRLSAFEKKLTSLTTEVEQLMGLQDQVQSDLAALTAENEQLRTDIAQLKTDNAQLKVDNTKAITDLKAQIQAAIGSANPTAYLQALDAQIQSELAAQKTADSDVTSVDADVKTTDAADVAADPGPQAPADTSTSDPTTSSTSESNPSTTPESTPTTDSAPEAPEAPAS